MLFAWKKKREKKDQTHWNWNLFWKSQNTKVQQYICCQNQDKLIVLLWLYENRFLSAAGLLWFRAVIIDKRVHMLLIYGKDFNS